MVFPYQSTKESLEILMFSRPNSRSTYYSNSEEGVYIISVASRILEMHPQTLRKYERAGFIQPSRTNGMLRLYSELDISRLKLIKHLVADLGLNLAGVQLALDVFNRLIKAKTLQNKFNDLEIREFMNATLDELFESIHAHKNEGHT
tara:strand:+ start:283 stop:723 length:441 start_codon:yes stop_codon:yes gene_type:complete